MGLVAGIVICHLYCYAEGIIANNLLYCFKNGELMSIVKMTSAQIFKQNDRYCFILGNFPQQEYY